MRRKAHFPVYLASDSIEEIAYFLQITYFVQRYHVEYTVVLNLGLVICGR